jgi:dipeptidyl-peptidase-3
MEQKLLVRLDDSRILTHGKPALVQMLLRLHIYRYTAQVDKYRSYHEDLTQVTEEFLAWRKVVLAHKLLPLLYVQSNTIHHHDSVSLKEYDASFEGIIQSWAKRSV